MKLATSNNIHSKAEENNLPFLKRFYRYQKERFPFMGHGLLVASFSFSAIAYSRICRGVQDFINWKTYFIGVFITITLFLLLRIFDEFKDAEDDAKYRKELPVPRGLVSLNELGRMAVVIILLQLLVNALFFPKMLLLYFIVIGYLLLMGKEFFIAEWLKKNQFWYVVSHMFIIPLVDIYASGLDWLPAGAAAPAGLLFFFAVSYMNGVVIEIGRKIRTPENEAEGVNSYTAMLGTTNAVLLWIVILFVTLVLSMAASAYAGYGTTVFVVLGCIFCICVIPAFLFLKHKTVKNSKRIEYASALWTIAMYLTLGTGPMLSKLVIN